MPTNLNTSHNGLDLESKDTSPYVGINSWTTETYVYVYSGIMASLVIIAAARSLIFYKTCSWASQNLHDSMLSGLISTTLRFFDENPVGRITNRFTKDLGSVDELLPKILLDAIQINSTMIGALIVTVCTDFKLSAVILLMGTLFIWARKLFLKCSTNIKRLEGTSNLISASNSYAMPK